jgi:hypothetical protein
MQRLKAGGRNRRVQSPYPLRYFGHCSGIVVNKAVTKLSLVIVGSGQSNHIRSARTDWSTFDGDVKPYSQQGQVYSEWRQARGGEQSEGKG